MLQRSKHQQRAVQGGMTLIEILVAIVVLSVGLLGLAGLQLKGLQVNQGSVYRWQASILAEDMADRLRADRVNAINGLYSGTYSANTAPAGTALPATEWADRLAQLPQAAATVAVVAAVAPAPPGLFVGTITVSWTDTRAATGSGVSQAAAAVAPQSSFLLSSEF
ncbi:MAG: type IV pilus modification protein PilV [Burkholderiaceae bacterium]|nr:type IV pilus modification protein PilV [Burkholderiaceae bacterium]